MVTVKQKSSVNKSNVNKNTTPVPSKQTNNSTTAQTTPKDFGEITIKQDNDDTLFLERSKYVWVGSGYDKTNRYNNDFSKWIWTNHNEDIISIESMTTQKYIVPRISIKAKKVGTAVLSITNGVRTAECTVKVTEEYAKFEFNEDGTEIIGCSNAKTATVVDIPDGVKKISCIFDKNNYLHKITMTDSVEEISSGKYYGSIFSDCPKLSNVKLSKSLKKLERIEFRGCALESIYIPPSIVEIGEYALSECDSLKTIYGEADSYAETWAASQGIAFIAQ